MKTLLSLIQRIYWIVYFLRWKKDTSRWKLIHQFKTSGKVILIVELFPMVSICQAHACFANLLARKGNSVFVLFQSKNKYLEEIYKSAGLHSFIYLDDFKAKFSAKELETEIDEGLNFDTQSIDRTTYNGNRIGRHILSKIVREKRIGNFKLNNLEDQNLFSRYLNESVLSLLASKEIIKNIKPDVFLFLERGYSPAGEVFDLAVKSQKIVVQWCSSPFQNKFLFKKYTQENINDHPYSIDLESWFDHLNEIEDFSFKDKKQQVYNLIVKNYEEKFYYNKQGLNEGKRIFSENEFRDKFQIDKNRKIAVIFSHIFYDATFFYGNSIYSDYETWLIETIRIAIKNPHIEWFVKSHPVNVWRSKIDQQPLKNMEKDSIFREIGELPKNIHFIDADTQINTFSLFNFIDYGITVRGTIGMELPCYGVPVLTAGDGRYSGLGFTLDFLNKKEYEEKLLKLHEVPKLNEIEINRAILFNYLCFHERPVHIESFTLVEKERIFGKIYPHQTLKLNKKSLADAEDLNMIVDWISNPTNRDLMQNKSRFNT